MKQGFNTNFYLMATTVIPVLYVALIVQFPLIARITANLADEAEKLGTRIPLQKSITLKKRIEPGLLVLGVVVTIAVGILIIEQTVLGEILGILAMFHQSNSQHVQESVLHSLYILLIINLFVPAWTVLEAATRFPRVLGRVFSPKRRHFEVELVVENLDGTPSDLSRDLEIDGVKRLRRLEHLTDSFLDEAQQIHWPTESEGSWILVPLADDLAVCRWDPGDPALWALGGTPGRLTVVRILRKSMAQDFLRLLTSAT
jgi:hypothetical protein